MDTSAEKKQRVELGDYLAAERTFLAWVRTGLALMGFGFVAARFGLFRQQLRLVDQVPSNLSYLMGSRCGSGRHSSLRELP